MLASIKHILIEVNQLKIGYTVRIDGLFGTIVSINEKENKIAVSFTDGSRYDSYTVSDLKYAVVKFLAIMRDLNSFPVIHGDFPGIISFFDTKEKVEAFVKGKEITAEGILQNILTYPKPNDVVELSSLKTAERHGLLSSRNDRIGIIEKKDRVPNKFIVKFPSKSISLRRTEFDILSGINSKQVFKLNDD
jgi:hypothetical protein